MISTRVFIRHSCINTAIFIFFFIISVVYSAIHRVPGHYSSIQSALNASTEHDTVLVDDGVYTENLIWPCTQGIQLLSVNGAKTTTIKAYTSDSVCTILIEPDSTTIIDTTTRIKGFRISDGIAFGM